MHSKISFVTTCKGRLAHLRETLPQNMADNADYPDLEFVVVDYNSEDGLKEWIEDNFQTEMGNGRLKYVHAPDHKYFHMAHAKNIAHRMATGDIICNIDADNFTKQGFAAYIDDVFRTTENIFLRSAKINRQKIPDTGLGGRIAVRRSDFYTVGGYNEDTSGWGPEDADFARRLERIGLSELEIPYEYLKFITHNDDLRFENYSSKPKLAGKTQTIELEVQDPDPGRHKASAHVDVSKTAGAQVAKPLKKRRSSAVYKGRRASFSLNGRHLVTVQNYGKIGCGTFYLNSDKRKIECGQMPTRLFGIGWHKTGTTSLHHALRILGFNSKHWICDMYPEIIAGHFNFQSVNEHYALSDFPIPLIFEKLDLAYPGSKFILTTRRTEAFLNSVYNHWKIGMRPAAHDRSQTHWDVVSRRGKYSHEIHELAYGRRTFDRKVFAQRFEAHNDKVQQFFAKRPEDLLVLDLDEGIEWEHLCGFLRSAGFVDLKTPQTPYPHSLKTVNRLKSKRL